MKLRTVKNCKFTKSWKSDLGYLARQACKGGVLLPLVLEFETFESLEEMYHDLKNADDVEGLRMFRYLEDVYNYGTFYILDDNFDNCDTCNLKVKCTDTCLQWDKLHNLFEEV